MEYTDLFDSIRALPDGLFQLRELSCWSKIDRGVKIRIAREFLSAVRAGKVPCVTLGPQTPAHHQTYLKMGEATNGDAKQKKNNASPITKATKNAKCPVDAIEFIEYLNNHIKTLPDGFIFRSLSSQLAGWDELSYQDRARLGHTLSIAMLTGRIPELARNIRKGIRRGFIVKRGGDTDGKNAAGNKDTEEKPYATFFQSLQEYVASLPDNFVLELKRVPAWAELTGKERAVVGQMVRMAVDAGELPGMKAYTSSGMNYRRYVKTATQAPAQQAPSKKKSK